MREERSFRVFALSGDGRGSVIASAALAA